MINSSDSGATKRSSIRRNLTLTVLRRVEGGVQQLGDLADVCRHGGKLAVAVCLGIEARP